MDAAKIGLNDLRTKIAIIPQDPVLFQGRLRNSINHLWLIAVCRVGTVRSNLDPFSAYDDEQLNQALRKAHLLDNNNPHRIHLDTILTSEGGNLSAGERALLSLSRALVSQVQHSFSSAELNPLRFGNTK